MARADWVVLDLSTATSRLVCRRCGAAEDVRVPRRVDVVVFQMQSYARLHGRCKEGGGYGR